MKPSNDSHYSSTETEQRLRKTLRAAFNMKPTPLKDIPKKTGEPRVAMRAKPKRVKT